MGKEIEFNDIRVGDAIQREYTLDDMVITHSGVVAKVDECFAYTASGKRLACLDWDDSTYILVHRPQPPLPTEPGARIKVTKLDGKSGEWLAKLSRSGSWIVFDLVGDDGAYWVQPFRIEEWGRIEIREVTP